MQFNNFLHTDALFSSRLLPFVMLFAFASGCKLEAASPSAKTKSGQATVSLNLTEKALAPMNEAVSRRIALGQLSGGVVTAVGRKDGVVQVKTYGKFDAEKDIPMREDAIFRLASSTKLITSSAFLTLLDDGKIASLDDPASRYLSELANEVVLNPQRPRSEWKTVKLPKSITVRDLMRHTAGYQYAFRLNELDKEYIRFGLNKGIRTLAEFVTALNAFPLAFEPGTRFSYSYSNDILGAVAEKVSGKSLDVFVKEALLDRLGMKDTGFVVPPEKASRLANFYDGSSGKPVLKEEGTKSPFLNRPKGLSGGGGWETGVGGMVSTVEDYGRLLRMLLSYGKHEGKQILKPATVRELVKDQLTGIPAGQGRRYPPDIDVSGRGFGLGSGVETPANDPEHPMIFWSGFPYNTTYFADFKLNVYGLLFTQSGPFESEYQERGLKPEFRNLVRAAVRN